MSIKIENVGSLAPCPTGVGKEARERLLQRYGRRRSHAAIEANFYQAILGDRNPVWRCPANMKDDQQAPAFRQVEATTTGQESAIVFALLDERCAVHRLAVAENGQFQ